MQKIREITFHKKILKKVQFDETKHCLPQGENERFLKYFRMDGAELKGPVE